MLEKAKTDELMPDKIAEQIKLKQLEEKKLK